MYFHSTISCTRAIKRHIRKFSSNTSKIKWEAIIGLEVHAQLQTKSKLFSGASSSFYEIVNNQVSFFDAAVPGTLPILNRECVQKGILSALALNCKIHPISWFDRKHYFYADLPAGYQITQQRAPFAIDGFLEFEVGSETTHASKFYLKKSKIKQIQLEQDSGKSLHDVDASLSLVDLNRAGNPLIEIVFEPDLNTGEEAACLVHELMLILRKLDTCSCKIQEGALRVDANISIRQKGEQTLGVRSEIKNIGGLKNISNAIDFEIKRQIRLRSVGKSVTNETRFWDAENEQTVTMRDKEMEQDYRFMPEPNLPPLRVSLDGENVDFNVVDVSRLKKMLPELPSDVRKRLLDKYKLSMNTVIRLLRDPVLLNHFISIIRADENRNSTKVSNFLMMDLKASFYKNEILSEKSPITSEEIGQLYDLLQNGIINRIIALKMLDMFVIGFDGTPLQVVEKNQWFQINDKSILEESVNLVIEYNPDMVNEYLKSKKHMKDKCFQLIFDESLKNTNKRANLLLLKEILQKVLDDIKK